MKLKPIEIKWVVFDAEANGLTPSKFYCVSWKDHAGQKGTIRDYSEIRDFFTRYEMYVGHNIRRWDIPNLERVVGTRVDGQIVDTLGIAWYLEPDRRRHGLESYGEDFGIPKPKIIDWDNQSQEDYEHRCEQDVEINFRLWQSQLGRLLTLYKESKPLLKFLRYLDFKLYAAHLAEESKWKLDTDRVQESIQKLQKERDQKLETLCTFMPRVPIVTTYQPPKRMFNSDGELSVLGQRWKDRLIEGGFPEGHGEPIDVIVGYDLPNPQSPDQVKAWLYSLGWRPRTIKFDRNKKTGETKEIPQVNLPHGAGLCESVSELSEKEPAVLALDALGVIKHRIGILTGYLRDVSPDGYLQASVAGLTNTLRFKHAEIVNLPKVEKAYGIDIRGPLIARDDHELCGSDMVSVEDRIKQHYLFPHDPEYVNKLARADYDPHLDLATLAGVVSLEEAGTYILVDRTNDKSGLAAKLIEIYKKVKPLRSTYKNGNYACQYGAGIPRLMITCDCDRATATRIHQTYWKLNWAIRAVAKEQTIQTIDGMMWLLNPVSGFWYSLRTEKDIFSTLVQGTAAYVFDKYLGEVLSRRPQLTGQFHDEFILEVRVGHQDEIKEFLNECIKEVNDELKLNRELGISIQFGQRYSDIH